jgi:hypothetical protein
VPRVGRELWRGVGVSPAEATCLLCWGVFFIGAIARLRAILMIADGRNCW